MTAAPLAQVGDVIEHGQDIPANVVRFTDSVGDLWRRISTVPLTFSWGGRPLGIHAMRDSARWWPFTVVEVDPEPQPAVHPHGDRVQCFITEPHRNHYWEARSDGRWCPGLASDPEPQPVEIAQAHNEDGVPLWMHLCGYVEAFRSVPLDEPPFGGGCDQCDSGYPQQGDWRPLLVEASHRPPGPAKVKQPSAPGPLVLTLPEVPAEAVALIGKVSGQRYTPASGFSWESEGMWFGNFGELLIAEDEVTVEFAPPREPRTWTFEPDQIDALKALLSLVHRDDLAEAWWRALPAGVREVLDGGAS